MEISFTRTGARRYAVTAGREKSARVTMDPAPGFDERLPHDLVHFVVEVHWGLRDGIFGQLDAGGDAHTFRPVDEVRTRRWARRSARRNSASGGDVGRSELLAAVTYTAWWARHGRALPDDMADRLAAAEITDAELNGALDRMDELSGRWRGLGVGESLTLSWPWPERAAGRRRA
ncbi:hypothetical protein [Pseudonocardia acaciae]|uniref:hypothetical protein n=1 Tax=Pseudonocardia acaciae TaxID=551276 RepID=UPI0004910C8B|nr:hypothetical protein [Pseudonocardia acaciae]